MSHSPLGGCFHVTLSEQGQSRTLPKQRCLCLHSCAVLRHVVTSVSPCFSLGTRWLSCPRPVCPWALRGRCPAWFSGTHMGPAGSIQPYMAPMPLPGGTWDMGEFSWPHLLPVTFLCTSSHARPVSSQPLVAAAPHQSGYRACPLPVPAVPGASSPSATPPSLYDSDSPRSHGLSTASSLPVSAESLSLQLLPTVPEPVGLRVPRPVTTSSEPGTKDGDLGPTKAAWNMRHQAQCHSTRWHLPEDGQDS